MYSRGELQTLNSGIDFFQSFDIVFILTYILTMSTKTESQNITVIIQSAAIVAFSAVIAAIAPPGIIPD